MIAFLTGLFFVILIVVFSFLKARRVEKYFSFTERKNNGGEFQKAMQFGYLIKLKNREEMLRNGKQDFLYKIKELIIYLQELNDEDLGDVVLQLTKYRNSHYKIYLSAFMNPFTCDVNARAILSDSLDKDYGQITGADDELSLKLKKVILILYCTAHCYLDEEILFSVQLLWRELSRGIEYLKNNQKRFDEFKELQEYVTDFYKIPTGLEPAMY